MAQILIRKLDEKVLDTLGRLAAEHDISREQLARDVLSEHARKHSREAIFRELAALRAAQVGNSAMDFDIVSAIREDRDR